MRTRSTGRPSGSSLVYSTYIGGSHGEFAHRIAVDSAGSAYITGETHSDDFPTANAFQPTLHGVLDAFVTKFSPSGSSLVYSTYLGGSESDHGQGTAVDASGAAFVTGVTLSADFPTADPYQPTPNGAGDVFVTKLSPSGTALVYSTYLGARRETRHTLSPSMPEEVRTSPAAPIRWTSRP